MVRNPERERRILDTAALAFHEKGFHGVGVDEIGRRAGLSGPAIYRHFAGKDQLLATLLDEALDELITATVPVLTDPSEDLRRAVRHHIGYAFEHRHLVALHHRESRFLADPWATSYARREGRYVRGWEEMVARAHPSAVPADVAAATQAVLGLVFSVASWPTRVATAPTAQDLLLGLVVSGLLVLDD